MSRAAVFLALAGAGCLAPPSPTDSVEEAQMVCAKGSVTKGVDVSHYDGAIDWSKVQTAGIGFAFIKATESTDFTDPEFAANWKYSQMYGIVRGAYHFFRASADPVQQADFFVQTMGPSLPGDLPPTIDLETLDGQTAATTTKGTLAFLAEVQKKTGRTPIIYTSASFMSTLGNPSGFSSYTLWVAHWNVMCPNLPPEWMDWSFWQTGSGAVNGIPSAMMKTDVDEFNGTLSDLHNFVGSAAPDGGSDGGTTAGDGGSGADDMAGANGDMAMLHCGTPGFICPGLRRSGCDVGNGSDGGGAWFSLALLVALAASRRRRAHSSPSK